MSKKLSTFVLLTLASASLQAAPNESKFPFPPPQNMLARHEPLQNVAETPKAAENGTIIDIVSTDATLSTFVKAVKAADLANTLKGQGPFTIFVPNDQAFAKLSPNALSDLFRPENKARLAAILTYHIVPGKLEMKSGEAKSVNGKVLNIQAKNGTMAVNNAKVVKKGISGSNGDIYVIDTVLTP